jgi:hypothetical protein
VRAARLLPRGPLTLTVMIREDPRQEESSASLATVAFVLRATNILAARRKRLEGAGIIVSTPYQQGPMRYAYTLTPKGSALDDMLLAFVR